MPRHGFSLDPNFSEKPSYFEIDFVLYGIRYHYGFKTTDDAFTSEWLYEIPKAHRRKLFERGEWGFDFGRWLKGQNRNIAKLTRSNSLFLSAAAQNGHVLLSRVYKYFQDITFPGLISMPGIKISTRLAEDGLDRRVIEFLKLINTGVVGYQKRETEVSDDLRTLLGIESKEDKLFKIELAHRGKGGEKMYLDLDLESAGMQRLLIILDQTFKALDKGLPICIDELDLSLHTHASEAILRLFCSPEVNQNGAQLIATTHDTNLMKSDTLRRDQLWFAEKGSEGATKIYPLTDIRTRKADNIELGYLQGRHGAVPSGDPVTALLESGLNGKTSNWKDKATKVEKRTQDSFHLIL